MSTVPHCALWLSSSGLHDEPAGTMIHMTIETMIEILVRLTRHSLPFSNCLQKLAQASVRSTTCIDLRIS